MYGPVSGHRHPGRRGGPPDPGGLRPPEPSTATRWPWPDGSPPAARRGSTWSISTPPGRAIRSTGRPCWPSPQAVDIPVETGGGVRVRGRRGRAARRRGGTGRSWARWRSRTPDWSRRWPPATRAGWRWASTTGAMPTGAPRWPSGGGSRAAAARSRPPGRAGGRRAGRGHRHRHRSRRHARPGPTSTGCAAVLGATTIPVIASGGVGSVADIEALARLRWPASRSGTAGRAPAWPGPSPARALVDGRMTVEEGVAACAPSG